MLRKLCFILFIFVIVGGMSRADVVPQNQQSSSVLSVKQKAQSLGEKMVDFIMGLLSNKPKPIQEALVRDDA